VNARQRRKMDRALGRWLASPTYRHLVALRGFDGFHVTKGGRASWAARCYLRPEVDVYVREQARERRRLGVL
jgi:hypothetical protein